MDASDFDEGILRPSLAWCRQNLPGQITISRNTHVLLLAIAGQESDWTWRVQQNNGPAHSFWQDERGGAIAALLHHARAGAIARALCFDAGVAADAASVWAAFALQSGDNLACAFARLLLWTDPEVIPDPQSYDRSWNMYLRNWRPGKPRRASWSDRVDAAEAAVPL